MSPAAIKYNVSGVEPDNDSVPPADVYAVKIISCVDAKPSGKDRRLEPVAEITEGDHKGFKFYDYINLENEDMQWKLAQFTRALGLPDSGTLVPSKLVGTECALRTIVKNSDEYGMQAKIRRWLPLDADAVAAKTEDLDDDDVATAEEGAEDEGGDTWTDEELKELAVKELVTIADEAELDSKEIQKGQKTAALKKKALVAAILEAQEAEDEDEDGADEDEEDGEESELWAEEELTELDDDDLKGVAAGDPEDDEDEGFGLDPADYTKTKTVKGKKKKVFDRDALIAAILEAQESGDEDEDEDEEEEDEDGAEDEAPDYEEMEPAALKALCKERDLPVKGTKKILIARLQKADEPV